MRSLTTELFRKQYMIRKWKQRTRLKGGCQCRKRFSLLVNIRRFSCGEERVRHEKSNNRIVQEKGGCQCRKRCGSRKVQSELEDGRGVVSKVSIGPESLGLVTYGEVVLWQGHGVKDISVNMSVTELGDWKLEERGVETPLDEGCEFTGHPWLVHLEESSQIMHLKQHLQIANESNIFSGVANELGILNEARLVDIIVDYMSKLSDVVDHLIKLKVSPGRRGLGGGMRKKVGV
ncbi:hypothetical protein VNO78_10650 [Psophocarpus tetragonolobus]|uniref:Uncharacterized protein n=1 Tax=Psophocarpus tetragonolobus TaxID=3891 RepID=A0AAN9SLN2_PSOTE